VPIPTGGGKLHHLGKKNGPEEGEGGVIKKKGPLSERTNGEEIKEKMSKRYHHKGQKGGGGEASFEDESRESKAPSSKRKKAREKKKGGREGKPFLREGKYL